MEETKVGPETNLVPIKKKFSVTKLWVIGIGLLLVFLTVNFLSNTQGLGTGISLSNANRNTNTLNRNANQTISEAPFNSNVNDNRNSMTNPNLNTISDPIGDSSN